MKNLLSVLFSAMFIVMLTGCGDDGSSNAGGGNDASMDTSGELPIGDLMSMGGDGSMDSSMDISALMGGLMGGDDSDDDGSDDESNDDDDGATNTAAPKFTDLGDITITFEGTSYPLKAAVGPSLVPTAYVVDENMTAVTIQVAAYDIRSDRLNLDTGSLVFAFKMPIHDDGVNKYLLEGSFPLLTPENESGMVNVSDVRVFNNSIYIEATVDGAELYGNDKEDIFVISIDFDIRINAFPSAQ